MVTEETEEVNADTLDIGNIVETSIAKIESTPLEVEAEKDNLEVEEQSTSKVRDEKGRFSRQETETPVTPEETTPEVPPIEPPQRWRPEDRALFSKAPREVQEAIQRREADFQEFERIAQSRSMKAENYAKQFEEVAKPYGYLLDKYQLSAPDAIDRLFHWNGKLESDPENTLHEIANSYGYQIQVTGKPQAPQGTHPDVERLNYELQMLKQQREHELRELQTSQLRQSVESWAHETDAAGKPLRPYFEDFRPHIREAVAKLETEYPDADPSAILSAAYDDVVARMTQKGFIRNGPAQDFNAIQSKTEAARRAASSLKAEPTSEPVTKRQPSSIGDIVQFALNQHAPD